MAIKKDLIIDVKTGDSEKNIRDVNKAVVDLNASFEDVYGETQTLTGRLGSLQDRLYQLAQAGDTASKEYRELTKEAGRLKQAQMETDKVIDATSQRLGSKLVKSTQFASAGVQVVTGGMAAMGVESENADKAIAGVVGAMAVTSGLETMQETFKSVRALGSAIKASTIFQKAATAAQWLWNMALNANPIGLIVIAVTALISAGYGLLKLFKFLTKGTEDYTTSVENNSKALDDQAKANENATKEAKRNADQQLAMAKAQGKSKEEIRELEKAIAQKTITDAEATKALADKTLATQKQTLADLEAKGVDEELIKAQEENVKKAEKILETSTSNLQSAKDNDLAITNRYLVEDAQAVTDSNKTKAEKQKEADDKAAEALKASREALKGIVEGYEDEAENRLADTEQKKLDLQKIREQEALDDLKLTGDEKLEAQGLLNDKFTNLQSDLNKKTKEERDKVLADDKKADDALKIQKDTFIANQIQDDLERLKRLKEILEEEKKLELERLTLKRDSYEVGSAEYITANNALESAKQGFAERETTLNGEVSDTNISIAEKERDAKMETLGAVGNALGAFTNLAGKETQAGKALAIAQATIATYTGMAEIWGAKAEGTATTTLLSKIAASAVVAANGFAAVKNIASTKVPSTSGGGGSAPSAPRPQRPTFNLTGSSGNSQLANLIGEANGNNQSDRPLKAYVIGKDVTTQQELDRQLEDSAEI